jgi:hypothetical protein
MKLNFFKNPEKMKKHYSKQESAELLELAKTTTNPHVDAKKYAKKTSRSYKSVYNRLYRTRVVLGLHTAKTKSVDPLKKTTFFYTKEQVSAITECLNDGMNPSDITRKFAMAWGLSFPSLYIKVAKIKHKLKEEPAPITKIVVEEQPVQVAVQEMELQMSSGSTFDCKPSRVTICKDHIRIYF